jgi:hypothetical protein
MKILYIKCWNHHKNYNFIKLCKKINFTEINLNDLDKYNLEDYDCVLSVSQPFSVKEYNEKYSHKKIKFIFGPHFSVFPEKHMIDIILSDNVYYNCLSDWVIKLWSNFNITNHLNLIKLPFGVDTNKFCEIKPISQRNDVLLYFKSRSPDCLNFIYEFCKVNNINPIYYNYEMKYDEENYLNSLQNTKYAIIIGRHESQGFAIQEAMSCNVPLLVWDCKNMNDEYNSNYEPYPSTSIPYWDNSCGEYFHNIEELKNVYDKFITNIENYSPRQFILDNLSIESCENNLIKFINS